MCDMKIWKGLEVGMEYQAKLKLADGVFSRGRKASSDEALQSVGLKVLGSIQNIVGLRSNI